MLRTWKQALFFTVVSSAIIFSISDAMALGSTPVTVVNLDNAPAPVHDAGQPQPVNGVCNPPGITGICDMYTVPAGKRLVVEMFSYLVRSDSSPTGSPPFLIRFGDSTAIHTICGSCPQAYNLPPTFAGSDGVGGFNWTDTRIVRMYLNENQTLSVSVAVSGVNNLGGIFVFSGFLVDK